jgi:broad specificity phosphatase PhoE
MTRLILIRHGETEWNETKRFQGISDIPLSSKGAAQALSLARSLAGEPLAAIYTSPLSRARQTAECLARYHSCPLRVVEDFKELNQGQLEGLTGEDLRRDFPGFISKWMEDPGETVLPGGESLGDLQRRAWEAAASLVCRHPEETVAVVAHSFVILAVLCRALELPLKAFRRFRQDPTGKNILEFSERGAALRCLNDTCHLSPVPPAPAPGEGRDESGKSADLRMP